MSCGVGGDCHRRKSVNFDYFLPTNDTQKGRVKAVVGNKIDDWVHARVKIKEHDRPTENV